MSYALKIASLHQITKLATNESTTSYPLFSVFYRFCFGTTTANFAKGNGNGSFA